MCAVLDGFVAADRLTRYIHELERFALRHADHFLWPGGLVLETYRSFYGAERVAAPIEVRHPVTPGRPGSARALRARRAAALPLRRPARAPQGRPEPDPGGERARGRRLVADPDRRQHRNGAARRLDARPARPDDRRRPSDRDPRPGRPRSAARAPRRRRRDRLAVDLGVLAEHGARGARGRPPGARDAGRRPSRDGRGRHARAGSAESDGRGRGSATRCAACSPIGGAPGGKLGARGPRATRSRASPTPGRSARRTSASPGEAGARRCAGPRARRRCARSSSPTSRWSSSSRPPCARSPRRPTRGSRSSSSTTARCARRTRCSPSSPSATRSRSSPSATPGSARRGTSASTSRSGRYVLPVDPDDELHADLRRALRRRARAAPGPRLRHRLERVHRRGRRPRDGGYRPIGNLAAWPEAENVTARRWR